MTLTTAKTLRKRVPLKLLAAALVASIGAAVSEMGLMGGAAALIAMAALHPPLYTLSLYVTLVRSAGLGRALFRYGERYLSHQGAFHLLTLTHRRLYEEAENKLPLRGGQLAQGQYLQALTQQGEAMRDWYLRGILPLAAPLFLTVAWAVWLWPTSPAAAFLPILALTGHLLLPWLVGKSRNETETEALTAYRNAILGIMAGRDELTLAGSLSFAENKLYLVAAQVRRSREILARQRNRRDGFLHWLRALTLTAVFALLMGEVATGRLGSVSAAVFVLVFMGLLETMAPLPTAVDKLRAGWTAARNLAEKSSTSPEKEAVAICSPKAPTLEVNDLTFSYRQGGVPLLKNLSFALQSGEKIIIRGESGSGKTTLAYLLLKLWEADQGHIYLEGRELSPGATRDYWAAAVQGGYIFNASVRENFQRLCPNAAEKDMWRALEAACLAAVIKKFPQGLDTALGENGGRLSGGERGRLLVAFALCREAPLLILDEPTVGLDRKTATKLVQNVLVAAKDKSLLLVTHDQTVLNIGGVSFFTLASQK
ncbi:MAG: ATP-binding cassette domain-containing protein [Selenomonadaceae bacterium]|nr:ATP-binding cassette domain-containing protein [Selenomonadaceae bacterium]